MNDFDDNHNSHQYQCDSKEDILSYITTDRFLCGTINNTNNARDSTTRNFQENFQALAFAMKSDLTNNNFWLKKNKKTTW